MTRLTWDEPREYEIGLDRGVFYPPSGPGQAWNGLAAVKESPTDADLKVRFLDGLRTNQRRRPESFSGSIEAFTYPEAFYSDILTHRKVPFFGMSYRTGFSDNYKIHLVYNLKISPVGFLHESFETDKLVFSFTTLPIDIPGQNRAAHIVVDTSKAYSWTIEDLENIIYGSDTEDPRLPLPQELIDLFESNAILRITDNGDGTWTAETDEDGIISFPTADDFEITWPSVVYLDADTYNISSL